MNQASLAELLKTALAFLDHGKPEPYENHHCGSESACDMNCMEVAAYGEFRRQARLALLDTSEDPRKEYGYGR